MTPPTEQLRLEARRLRAFSMIRKHRPTDASTSKRMSFPLAAVAATLLCAGCGTSRASTQDYPPPPEPPGIPMAPDLAQVTSLPGARTTADRVMTFLYGAKSTADFSVTNVSQKLGVDLQPDAERGAGWFVYRSPDLGDGWTYGVRVAPGQPPFKPGFHFWFERHQPLSEPARICALPSDLLEADLVKHGFAQANAWSELGWSHDLT